MEFNYYKSELVLSENASSNTEDCPAFDRYVKEIKKELKNAGVDLESVTIFYKRNRKRESIVGIQVIPGDKYDPENYFIFDAHSFRFSAHSSLVVNDIDMHAPVALSSSFNDYVNMLSRPTTDFLNGMENRIQRYIALKEEYDIMKTVSLTLDDEERPGGLLRRLFGKKGKRD